MTNIEQRAKGSTMSGVPHHCPRCLTDDGWWAYGILIFKDVMKPCPNCGSVLVPVKQKLADTRRVA